MDHHFIHNLIDVSTDVPQIIAHYAKQQIEQNSLIHAKISIERDSLTYVRAPVRLFHFLMLPSDPICRLQ